MRIFLPPPAREKLLRLEARVRASRCFVHEENGLTLALEGF
jgi:hypothetical protein